MMDHRQVCGFHVVLLVVSLGRASPIKGTITPSIPSAFNTQDLKLNCTLDGSITDDISSKDISFEFTNPNVQSKAVSKVVDNRIVSLTILGVYLNMSSSKISCHLGNKILDEVTIVVEAEPRFPNATKCIVYNWERMVCSWEWEEENNISISLAYSRTHGRNGQWFECPKLAVKSCTWDSSTKDQYFEASYTVVLYRNRSGAETELLGNPTTYDSKRIVKPEKVNVASVNVSTNYISMNFFTMQKPVLFRVAYVSQFSKTEIRNTTAASIKLSNLIPNTNYTIDIDCIPLGRRGITGFWSDKLTVEKTTGSDVPGASPSLSPGGFQIIDGSHRTIKLFFKPVDHILSHGEVQGYRINYTVGSSSNEISNQTTGSVVLLLDALATNAILPLEKEETYVVSMEMRNVKGYNESLAPTRIVIGKQSELPPFPEHFVVQKDDDDTYTLNWTSVDEASSYTLYWCHSDIRLFECKNLLNWKVMPSNQTSEVIQVVGLPGFLVRFAISVEKKVPAMRETLSSGMLIVCTYFRTGELKPPVVTNIVRMNQSAVSFILEKNKCDQTAYASQYAIEYCPVKYCREKKKLMVDSLRGSVTIHGLDADEAYNIQIWSMSETGKNSPAVVETVSGKQQDQQSYPVGVYVGLAVLIVASCFIPLIIKFYRWAKKKWHIEVTTPPKYDSDTQAKSPETTDYSTFLRSDLDSNGQVHTTVCESSHKDANHCYFNSASFQPDENKSLLSRTNSEYKSSTSSSEMSFMPSTQSNSASSDLRRDSATSASISGYNVVIQRPGETSGSSGGSRTSDEGVIVTTEIC